MREAMWQARQLLFIHLESTDNTKNFREFPGGLVVRILGFHSWDQGSVPGQGTEIPQALQQHLLPPKRKEF